MNAQSNSRQPFGKRSVPGDELATSRVAAAIAVAALQGEDDFLARSLASVRQVCQANYVALVQLLDHAWQAIGEAGATRALPDSLLADALDAERQQSASGWLAAPVDVRSVRPRMLVIHSARSGEGEPSLGATAMSAANALGQTLAAIEQRQSQRRRLERLEAILQAAGRWGRRREMEPLLVEMAEAATRLLDADRASIFLWDRPNRTLVGRPALGVAGGELRIADNAGVVGQVLQTGQPRRVDLASGQEEINRHVDKQTGYQTRTLLCSPLRGRGQELFGVFEVINKRSGNFNDEDLDTLERLAAQAAIVLENTKERESLLHSRRVMTDEAAQGVRLIGDSLPIAALRSTIGRVAVAELAVLILGENGTGKEVVSQSIHYLSPRRDQPFIAVNCAAISETLLESELFGHEKGAFTDAHGMRPGKFELASGGTLFLDEIGDLSPGGQAKLLRVLEEKVVVRVGGSTAIHTDARVIAATNQNLAEMVRQKKFRQDLYFRLNVVCLTLPPLRDRPEDIWPLAEHFLRDFCRKARRQPLVLSPQARLKLEQHRWPGNVRELRNVMERLAYLSVGDRVEADDPALAMAAADEPLTSPPGNLELAAATDIFQTNYIQRAIDKADGNMSEAARRLGLHRSNLYRKMRQLGMKTGDEDRVLAD